MIRFNAVSFMLMLAVSFSTAYADTYSWTDEQGTIHFTEDPGTVPKNVRNKALRKEETESAPETKPVSQDPSAKAPEATLQAVPSVGDGDSGLYAGKTYEQWQKELGEREAAMTAVRKRIDEITALVNKSAANWDEQKKLLLENKSLSAQLKEMKAEYFQQVEIARKAGLIINIQQ